MLGHGMVSVNMALHWPWSSWRMAMTCHGCRSPSKLGLGPGHRPFPGSQKSHRKWRTSHFWAKVDGKVVALLMSELICNWKNFWYQKLWWNWWNWLIFDTVDVMLQSRRLMVSPIMVPVLLIIQLYMYIYILLYIYYTSLVMMGLDKIWIAIWTGSSSSAKETLFPYEGTSPGHVVSSHSRKECCRGQKLHAAKIECCSFGRSGIRVDTTSWKMGPVVFWGIKQPQQIYGSEKNWGISRK